MESLSSKKICLQQAKLAKKFDRFAYALGTEVRLSTPSIIERMLTSQASRTTVQKEPSSNLCSELGFFNFLFTPYIHSLVSKSCPSRRAKSTLFVKAKNGPAVLPRVKMLNTPRMRFLNINKWIICEIIISHQTRLQYWPQESQLNFSHFKTYMD